MPDGGIERNASPEGAADENRALTVRHRVQHRHQGCEGGEALRLGACFAETTPVVADCFVSSAYSIQLSTPHAPVAYIGVKKDDRRPAAADLGRKLRAAGRDMVDGMHGP